MRRFRHARAALGLALLVCGACAKAPEPSVPPPEPPPPPRAEPRPPACERVVRLEMHKSARTLRAVCQGGAELHWVAAVGREPLGHKRAFGDLRTPEGTYRIAGPAETSRFHAFVPIDYPSVRDADVAFAEGRIDAVDHERIVSAHAQGELPPPDTPLGGFIGIHGEGERWAGESIHLDWTLGCVALSDADLDYLIERIEPGVVVVIRP